MIKITITVKGNIVRKYIDMDDNDWDTEGLFALQALTDAQQDIWNERIIKEECSRIEIERDEKKEQK